MEKQNWKPLSRQGVRARMGICSDLHVCGSYPSREKLHAVFSAFHQLDPLMDAAAFVGDLTDFGTKEQYAYLGKLIQENAADGIPAQLIYCIGNQLSAWDRARTGAFCPADRPAAGGTGMGWRYSGHQAGCKPNSRRGLHGQLFFFKGKFAGSGIQSTGASNSCTGASWHPRNCLWHR